MDAFAVSLCKGMASCGKTNVKGALLAGLYFGGFQALMPLIGYFVGAQFYEKIAFIIGYIHTHTSFLRCLPRTERKGENCTLLYTD